MRRRNLIFARLQTMQEAELKTEWAQRYAAPAPSLPAELLRLGFGYQLQQQRMGGLSRSTWALLRQLAAKGKDDAGRVLRHQPGLLLVPSQDRRTAGASFVSVTQAFNTTTSMGRLTLNVLLSFAQFEREVTGERIRDKIAASKKKGLWVGGPVPLGYRVEDRRLLPEPAGAETVRHILRRYLELGSVPELITQLRQEDIVTKVQHRSSGPHRGGIPFARGSLYRLLKNSIYRGKIVHEGEVYPGQHEAIVDEELWQAVQTKLQENSSGRLTKNSKQHGLLQGLLSDGHGRPMVVTYSCKGSRRYAYYQTRKSLLSEDASKAVRFRRHLLEQHITLRRCQLLTSQHDLQQRSGIPDARQLQAVFQKARQWHDALRDPAQARMAIQTLLRTATIRTDDIELKIRPDALGIDQVGDLAVIRLAAKWIVRSMIDWHLVFGDSPATTSACREARLRIDAGASSLQPANDANRDLLLLQLTEINQAHKP